MASTTKTNSNKYIWELIPFDKDLKSFPSDKKNIALYKLLPTNTFKEEKSIDYFDILKTFISPVTIVPIINYSWTTSPLEARTKIPHIILRERQLWKNNSYAKLAYNLSTTSETLDETIKNLTNATNDIDILVNTQSILDALPVIEEQPTSSDKYNFIDYSKYQIDYKIQLPDVKELVQQSWKEPITLSAFELYEPNNISGPSSNKEQLNNKTKESINKVKAYVKKCQDSMTQNIINQCVIQNSLKSSVLDAYSLLYLCLYSGFEYVLPYFDNNMRNVNNTFNNGDYNKAFLVETAADMVSYAMNFAGGINMILNPEQQGYYIEQAKPFQYPSVGETININFPLNNTGTWEDVIKNWQFVYMLLYQNQPTRVTKTIISPPAIYEVEIPGVRYIPYAYIKNVKVEYNGIRRYMNMKIKKGLQIEEIKTIIPESFTINITLEGLTSEPTNFNILENNIVTTKKI